MTSSLKKCKASAGLIPNSDANGGWLPSNTGIDTDKTLDANSTEFDGFPAPATKNADEIDRVSASDTAATKRPSADGTAEAPAGCGGQQQTLQDCAQAAASELSRILPSRSMEKAAGADQQQQRQEKDEGPSAGNPEACCHATAFCLDVRSVVDILLSRNCSCRGIVNLQLVSLQCAQSRDQSFESDSAMHAFQSEETRVH